MFFSYDKEYHKLLKESFPERNNYITFRYMIPFRMPFRGATYLELEGVLFTFLHREYKQPACKDFSFLDGKLKYMIVEATLPLTLKKKLNIYTEMRKRTKTSDEFSSDVFDKQLNILNNYCQTLLVMYGLYNIESLSLKKIIGVPEYILFNDELGDAKIDSFGHFYINNNKHINEANMKYLTDYEINASMNYFQSFQSHPLHMFNVYSKRGEKAYYDEDFNQTIIYLQTSMEIYVQQFITKCYRMMKWKPEHKIRNLEKKKEFTKHIDHHLLSLIKRLDLQNEELLTKLLIKYKNTSFQYRNNIVHEGTHYGREKARDTKILVSDIVNLFLYDIRNAPSNNFVEYYKNLYGDTPNDLSDLLTRYNIKMSK